MLNDDIVQVGVGDDADTGLPEEDLEVDIQGYPKSVYFPKKTFRKSYFSPELIHDCVDCRAQKKFRVFPLKYGK